MHDGRLGDQTDEWASWRTPTAISNKDLVIPEPVRACADIAWREALRDPWFFAVVLGFLCAALGSLVMYWPARMWAKWRRWRDAS